MAKQKSQDEELVEGATIRASIIGWLQGNPGKHNTTAVAEAIGRERPSVAQALYQLNKAGLIGKDQILDETGKHNLYFANGHEVPPAEATPTKRKYQHKVKAVTDVELIVAGVEIVIGRNPATGRLRITLEG